jgi:hypothetical protein
MNEKREKTLKLIIGIATLVFLFWFVRSSGVVHEACRSSAESGKLGNPAVAGVVVLAYELLVVIGGFVLVMFTGIWKFIAGYLSPIIAPNEPHQDDSMTAESFIQAAINNHELSQIRRDQLEQALILSIEKQDWQSIVKITNLLAGREFWPTKKKPNPTEEAEVQE